MSFYRFVLWGVPLGVLGASGRRLGHLLGNLGARFGPTLVSFGVLLALLGVLGRPLGRSWGPFGVPGRLLGSPRGDIGVL